MSREPEVGDAIYLLNRERVGAAALRRSSGVFVCTELTRGWPRFAAVRTEGLQQQGSSASGLPTRIEAPDVDIIPLASPGHGLVGYNGSEGGVWALLCDGDHLFNSPVSQDRDGVRAPVGSRRWEPYGEMEQHEIDAMFPSPLFGDASDAEAFGFALGAVSPYAFEACEVGPGGGGGSQAAAAAAAAPPPPLLRAAAATPFVPDCGPAPKVLLLHHPDSTGPGLGAQWLWALAYQLKIGGAATMNAQQLKADERWAGQGGKYAELLLGAKLVVPMLSAAYLASPQSRDELRAALAAGVPVLPLFLEDVTTDGAFLGEDPAALELAETFRAEALVQRVPAAGGVTLRAGAGADAETVKAGLARLRRTTEALAALISEKTADHSFFMY